MTNIALFMSQEMLPDIQSPQVRVLARRMDDGTVVVYWPPEDFDHHTILSVAPGGVISTVPASQISQHERAILQNGKLYYNPLTDPGGPLDPTNDWKVYVFLAEEVKL